MADHWRRNGKADQALTDYQEAMRVDPSNAQAYYGRGLVWEEKKNYDRAIADFSEAIRRDPKHANAYFYRAFTWRKKDDLDRALADYAEAIRLDPKDTAGYFNRASIWRIKNNPTRAVADYTEAIRYDPGYTNAYTRRGLTYESMGDRERARADFRTALSLPAPKDDNWAHETARARLALLPEARTEPRTPSPPLAPGPASTANDGGSRIALVIGNGAYQNEGKLGNTTNDARAMSAALRDIGFEVIEGTDLDYAGMERLIRDFLRRAVSARVALLFFSGHGSQIDGKNYLLPIDAKPVTRATIAFERIDLDRILAGMEDDSRSNIIILDACRNNPFEPTTTKAAGGAGLAPYSNVGAGTLIAFATAPNKTSTTGKGTISPFTAALVKHIRTPGLELYQLLLRVRVEVAEATQKQQIPWVNSSLLGEVYLAGRRQAATR
jgi:tetratricopeptide (TPR) repeat protein